MGQVTKAGDHVSSSRVPSRRYAARKFEDAKVRLSELVRGAREQGSRRATMRGVDAIAVIAAEDAIGFFLDRPSLCPSSRSWKASMSTALISAASRIVAGTSSCDWLAARHRCHG